MEPEDAVRSRGHRLTSHNRTCERNRHGILKWSQFRLVRTRVRAHSRSAAQRAPSSPCIPCRREAATLEPSRNRVPRCALPAHAGRDAIGCCNPENSAMAPTECRQSALASYAPRPILHIGLASPDIQDFRREDLLEKERKRPLLPAAAAVRDRAAHAAVRTPPCRKNTAPTERFGSLKHNRLPSWNSPEAKFMAGAKQSQPARVLFGCRKTPK